MAEMAERCRERYGRIDMLFASAGIGATAAKNRLPVATARLPLAEWQGVIDVNLHGVFLSNTAVLPLMLAQGRGDIVNICSSTTPTGLRGRPFAQAYSASKFAMAAFTEALADEVAPLGVYVTAVFPGPVNTPLIENTALDTPFGERIEAGAFAGAVLDLLELAPDVPVDGPHILPLAGRAKAAGARGRAGALNRGGA
jgi:NAD(P)-dependent dehydrogenase (short-subunit alcohol dehydrogenase family)